MVSIKSATDNSSPGLEVMVFNVDWLMHKKRNNSTVLNLNIICRTPICPMKRKASSMNPMWMALTNLMWMTHLNWYQDQGHITINYRQELLFHGHKKKIVVVLFLVPKVSKCSS